MSLRPDWSECFKFSFIRNPWDRAVSLYMHQTNGEQRFKDWLMDIVKRDGHPKDNNKKWSLSPKMASTGGTGVPWKCQADWLIDDSGEICMDFIGRFENLHEDVARLSDMIGKKLVLPHINKTNHDRYLKYYNEESANIVADWHHKDIKRFGYSFGRAITLI